MKKFICAVFTFVSVLFFSFGQSAEELEKIDLVLSKMSARARKEISISNKEEFIKDLKNVLAEEKKYTQEDLPLYFLIDLDLFWAETGNILQSATLYLHFSAAKSGRKVPCEDKPFKGLLAP